MPVYVQEENRNGYDGGYFTVAELIQVLLKHIMRVLLAISFTQRPGLIYLRQVF